MTPFIALLIVIAVSMFGYNLFLRICLQRIEKHMHEAVFRMALIFLSIVPVFGNFKNTSAIILASRANISICIFYISIIIIILLTYN